MNLADQLGITLRGVQTGLAKTLRQFQPGGSTFTGQGVPVLRGESIPKLSPPKIPVMLASGRYTTQAMRQTISTSPTPGRMAAPHPTRIPTESTLGLGFRNMRRGR